jgi:D-lyxose ketol-isomerase
VLLYANEVNGKLAINAVKMEPMKVYDIPPALWHNTVTQKDTKMILVEDSSTGSENSDVRELTSEQIADVKRLVAQ